jgi:hypothetical protein
VDELVKLRDFPRTHVVEHSAIVVAVKRGRLFNRHGVGFILGDVHAEAEGLNAIVRFACGARLRIGVFETKKNFARVCFAISLTALSSDAIRHAS